MALLRLKSALTATCLITLTTFASGSFIGCLLAQDKSPQLFIVDRSESKDGRYYCSVNFKKSDPVETIGLILKDRKGIKFGDMGLATIDTSPTERMAPFFLNHELIKNSVVLVTFSDDRANMKFIVGENQSLRRRDGKLIQVPIE
jgi:hypothetical protein